MSHANAAPDSAGPFEARAAVVDQGWPVARATERHDVSWPTAKQWADRYRQLVRKIVHLRWKQRLGRSRSPRGSASPRQLPARYWPDARSAGSPMLTG